MVKVGNFYYDGDSFLQVTKILNGDIKVRVVSSRLLWLDSGSGSYINNLNNYKDLGSNEEVIQELYPDYYKLSYDHAKIFLYQSNQFGKTSGRMTAVIKGITI